jgi:hypothetical protein
MPRLTAIGFDGDGTLWQNEPFFRQILRIVPG